MILKGSQRGGGMQLAVHLMNMDDNDHVEVMELRGFVSDDLAGALAEAHAVSKGTRARQFMFSLSLNPPKDADVGVDTLIDAVDRVEERLGLKGQPRAIVVHEKAGRRHAHVVWSRIDVEEMKAIELPFFKNRLMSLSKELYLENGWGLPDGFKENGWKNPLNFTLAEWQQAKRLDLDPREIRQVFQTAWRASDNQKSFRNALEENGFFLAAGVRRGFVATDINGEVFSVARMTGVRTKELGAKLGSPEKLPGVEQVREEVRGRLSKSLRAHLREFRTEQKQQLAPLRTEQRAMVMAQRAERAKLRKGQQDRWTKEARARAERFRKGVRGVWEILTGRAAVVRRENDRDAFTAYRRDVGQREALFAAQLKDRSAVQQRLETMRSGQRRDLMRLARQVGQVLGAGRDAARGRDQEQQRGSRKSRGFDMD
jgi:hypothetical protein